MRKLYAILLAIIIFPKAIGAQTSFDSGEGCLNIVDIACRAVPGENGNTGISANYLHERLISEQFSAGAGAGYTYLDNYGFSAIPVFLSAHYFFMDQRFSPFVNLRAGGFFMLGTKSTDTYQQYSISSRIPGFNLYVSAGAGVKMHITPHMGVTAAICDDAFLVNSFDTRRNDYHTGMVHSLDISLGICFQIPGW